MMLQKVGIDTPQEFVLLILTILTQIYVMWMAWEGKMPHETIFLNPLVGFWLGKTNGTPKEPGNGNG